MSETNPRTLDEFPRRRRGRPPKYDWDAYFNGEINVLYQGVDFNVPLDSFRALVHRTANSRGMKAHTQVDNNNKYVAFKFVEAD